MSSHLIHALDVFRIRFKVLYKPFQILYLLLFLTPWPSAEAYITQISNLGLALIHATDPELTFMQQTFFYHLSLLKSVTFSQAFQILISAVVSMV